MNEQNLSEEMASRSSSLSSIEWIFEDEQPFKKDQAVQRDVEPIYSSQSTKKSWVLRVILDPFCRCFKKMA